MKTITIDYDLYFEDIRKAENVGMLCGYGKIKRYLATAETDEQYFKCNSDFGHFTDYVTDLKSKLRKNSAT